MPPLPVQHTHLKVEPGAGGWEGPCPEVPVQKGLVVSEMRPMCESSLLGQDGLLPGADGLSGVPWEPLGGWVVVTLKAGKCAPLPT